MCWKEEQGEHTKWRDDPEGGGEGGRGKRQKKKRRHYGDPAPEEGEVPKEKREEKTVEQIVYREDPNEVGEDDADVVDGFYPPKRRKKTAYLSNTTQQFSPWF